MITYNEDSIQGLNDIQHILLRTSAYIPDKGVLGQTTITREIIDNSVDELVLKGKEGFLEVFMFIDHLGKKYQMAVRDNGRGVPVGKMVESFSEARTSGKFNTTSGYGISGGLFGSGSTITLALSSWFRAIALNTNVIGDVTLHRDTIGKAATMTLANQTGTTGTIVMFEPDTEIFTGFSEYIEKHGNLEERLSQLSLFSEFNIKFYVINEPIPKLARKASTLQVIDYFNNIVRRTAPAFDNSNFDRENYIQYYFGISSKWSRLFPISGKTSDNKLHVDGDLRVLLTSTVPSNTKLTFVNSILFNDSISLHITLLQAFIKEKLMNNITDKSVRSFFIENYKLPIWMVLNVGYSGAQFSGMAKTSFRDLSFKAPYKALLNQIITPEILNNLYSLIADHIQVSFNKFSNKDFVTTGSMRNLMTRLNRPEKFDGCSTTDREAAELFLVEGDSAKGSRNTTFQASYTLGGKPFNGLVDLGHIPESVNKIKNNAIYQDIIRILNITPGSNDLSRLNFSKIFIMADADTHGYHITSIVIGNLYLLCPALINEGHVYVTMPPLYSLNSKGNAPIYIRNAEELNATMAYQVYYRCLDLTIKTNEFEKLLTREEFVAFSELIIKIGDELDRLSVEYMIPAILLEQLSLMTNHLNINPPNVSEIRRWLGCDVRHVENSNLLIISIGSEDIVVPLNQITELIYSRILPLYRTFYYGKSRIFATTKNSPALNNSPVTIVQVNEMFKRMMGMFTTKRYKGLGSMEPKDLSRNCTAPSTRRVYRITSIGDIKSIFEMLGSDSSARKTLMSV